MNRKRLTFYTNMPTPYQIDFFNELKNHFQLTAVYFTDREKDRQWNLSGEKPGYRSIVLKNSLIARLVQKKIISFHFSWGIIPQLLKDDADFIITNGTYFTPNIILALIIGKLRGKKVFFWSEPLFPVTSKISYFIKYLLLLPVRTCTHAIFAIGKNAVESFKKYGYRKQIFNIPYNIDISLFSRQNLDNQTYRLLYATYKSNEEVVFLTSCNLTHRKGVDTVIKAFLKIPKTVKAKLLVLGEGPERSNLEKLAYPSEGRIVFLGFIEKEQLPYYFSIADNFAFASRYDGWALVINEALAADMAIICSNQVGAAADKLVHGYNALIFSPDDVNALYDAMQQLISDRNFRSMLIENGKSLKNELSSEYNAKQVYGLCNSFK